MWRNQNYLPSVLNLLSGWWHGQAGCWSSQRPLCFLKLRLSRNVMFYELLSISSKLHCLLPGLGSCSSFVSSTIVVCFSVKEKRVD